MDFEIGFELAFFFHRLHAPNNTHKTLLQKTIRLLCLWRKLALYLKFGLRPVPLFLSYINFLSQLTAEIYNHTTTISKQAKFPPWSLFHTNLPLLDGSFAYLTGWTAFRLCKQHDLSFGWLITFTTYYVILTILRFRSQQTHNVQRMIQDLRPAPHNLHIYNTMPYAECKVNLKIIPVIPHFSHGNFFCPVSLSLGFIRHFGLAQCKLCSEPALNIVERTVSVLPAAGKIGKI